MPNSELADDRSKTEAQPLLDNPLQPPPNLFEPPGYLKSDGRWDGAPNNNFDMPMRHNPFTSRGNMNDPTKQPNPFNDKSHDMMQQLQQQQQQQQLLMQQQRIGRGTNAAPDAFNNQRGFLYGNGPAPGGDDSHTDMNPFMINNNARGPPPFVQQQPSQQQSPLNFRGPPNRNNSPYFRNDKNGGVGGRGGGPRGGFRSNFRGRNW